MTHVLTKPEQDPGGRQPTIRRPSWLLWTLLVIAGIAVIASPSVLHQLALSFTHERTTGAEVYFTDPGALPTQLSLGTTRFSFTIQSYQPIETAFGYTVTLTGGGTTRIIATGSVREGAGGSVPVPVTFTPGRANTEYVVTVGLTDRSQFIDFRATT